MGHVQIEGSLVYSVVIETEQYLVIPYTPTQFLLTRTYEKLSILYTIPLFDA